MLTFALVLNALYSKLLLLIEKIKLEFSISQVPDLK